MRLMESVKDLIYRITRVGLMRYASTPAWAEPQPPAPFQSFLNKFGFQVCWANVYLAVQHWHVRS